jgi:hypothetical protein
MNAGDTPAAGGDPAYETAARLAAGLDALFTVAPAITEAELAAEGIHPVSIVHGYRETDEDARLIGQVRQHLAEECGLLAGRRGGNDYTTYLFAGPSAAGAAVTFTTKVLEIAPRWWRMTPTAHPVWRT